MEGGQLPRSSDKGKESTVSKTKGPEMRMEQGYQDWGREWGTWAQTSEEKAISTTDLQSILSSLQYWQSYHQPISCANTT